MWLGLAKMALQTGAKVYANKQRTKQAMSDAALLTAEKQARGEIEYNGKLLEARQNDYKDEVVLCILTLPILVLAYGVWSDDPQAMEKILVVASIFGIKGTQIFRGGGPKLPKK